MLFLRNFLNLTDEIRLSTRSPLCSVLISGTSLLFRIILFSYVCSGRGELAERQQKLGRMLSKLMKLAEEFNIAVSWSLILYDDCVLI